VGLVGLVLVSTTPAAAQSACQDGGNVLVEFLGVGTSNTVLMAQVAGGYEGQVRVRVYCGADGTLVPNSAVEMWTNVPNSSINGTPATESDPVTVRLPSGEDLVWIRSDNPDLSGWKARVGTNTVTVIGAYGSTIDPKDYPTASGAIWAQTPELGSLALFGSGAAGMAGYGFMRLRAARSRGRRG
jgi:hypothetical protein